MATFTVTNLFDSGMGSLRNAIFRANTASTTDDIAFNPSLSGGTIGLTSGELGISDNLTINGLGADLLSVDAGGNSRIFNVDDGDENSDLEVAINGLTITGGNASDGFFVLFNGGGGIRNSENLTVSNSTLSGNTVENGDGGGSGNFGDLRVSNSNISGNTADEGGGINNGGDLRVSNSTISGNTAEEGGGIISFEFYNNGTATVTSSIIAANTDNQDIEGDPFTSGGNNLIGNGDGATGFTNGATGDLVGTTSNPIDPLLGSLQNNGGPTQTQALLTGSPAIDAGSNPLNLEFDQRGPGFDRVVGVQTDIGAYEVVPEPDSTLGVLGVAVLGVILFRKRQRLKKNNPI